MTLEQRNKIMGMIATISRLLLGVVFTFSGFVKIIDPLGTTYKIEDYLHAFGGFFLKIDILAFPAAMCLVTLEFVLGLSLLLHIKPKLTPWLLLVFMLFMTPLTLYIALYNPVSDCGCFGDALILSNWATFWKNIVLCLLLLLVFLDYKHIHSLYTPKAEWSLLVLLLVASLTISIYCLRHLPLLDFRPYKVCADIPALMEIPDDAPHDKYEVTLVYENNGVEKEFTLEDYPRNDSTWHFVKQNRKLVEKGYEPPIHDFVLVTNGEDPLDITDEILSSDEPIALLIMYDLRKTNISLLRENLDELKDHYDNLYAVTGSGSWAIKEFAENQDLDIPFLTCDPVTLKTIVRANPGVIVLQRGRIMEKYNLRDIQNQLKNKLD